MFHQNIFYLRPHNRYLLLYRQLYFIDSITANSFIPIQPEKNDELPKIVFKYLQNILSQSPMTEPISLESKKFEMVEKGLYMIFATCLWRNEL